MSTSVSLITSFKLLVYCLGQKEHLLKGGELNPTDQY